MEGAILYDLTLYRLLVFRTVLETGSFSAAARRLRITQPAVSAHIKTLEAAAGLPLLERGRGRLAVPTPAGELVLSYANTVTRDTDDIMRILAELRSGGGGTLTVAAAASMGRTLLLPVLVAFQERHPAVQISLLRTSTQSVMLDLVERGKIDVAVVLTDPLTGHLSTEAAGYMPLLMVTAPGHPLAARRGIKPQDLAATQFITGVESSLHQRLIQQRLGACGLTDLPVRMQLEDAEAIKALVMKGLGAAVLAQCSVDEELADGRLVALDLAEPPQPLVVRLVYHPRRQRIPLVRRFVTAARDFLKQALPTSPEIGAGQGPGLAAGQGQ